MTRTPAWPLMSNNIQREDLDGLVSFLREPDIMLTQSRQVLAFEREWSEWLGRKYSVFVNSGASANLLTMTALKHTLGPGEIIVPPLTWVSDIASVLQCGFTPVFVDIDPKTLGMDPQGILRAITPRTKAVFLTHVLGYNALTRELLDALAARGIPLIEDVCESYGATFEGRKLGQFGQMANFSFYYAHHMTTIEGGMISTDDPELYEILRMLRSHGMVRESSSDAVKRDYQDRFPDLNPDFIFAYPAYNVRSTEINAVLGRSQLVRLDANNQLRQRNLKLFLDNLDPKAYFTEFATAGNCNYALTLVLREPDMTRAEQVMALLRANGVEFRRGTAGGGNQLRQPYLRALYPEIKPTDYPHVDHIHFFGFYLGNYPELDPNSILDLCARLNALAQEQAP